jgi:hypothetical protein
VLQMPEEVVEFLVVLQKGIRQQMELDNRQQLAIRPARTQGSHKLQLQTLLWTSLATDAARASSTQPGCKAEAVLVQEFR